MEYIAKASDKVYKLLAIVLYAEGTLDYVTSNGNRFTVLNRPLLHRFSFSVRELHGYWKSLERMGYIYGLEFECGAAKFYLRYPQCGGSNGESSS